MTAQPRTEHETRYARIVGRNVRLRRASMRLTTAEMESALRGLGLNMSATGITKIERGSQGGRFTAVTVDQLMAFASVFRCRPEDLLREAECETCYGAPPPGFRCAACGSAGPAA